MKKLLLTLGTLATIAAPVAAVVSCGSKDNSWVDAKNAKLTELVEGFMKNTPTAAEVALYHELKASKSKSDYDAALLVYKLTGGTTSISWSDAKANKIEEMTESFKTHTASKAENDLFKALKNANTEAEYNIAVGITKAVNPDTKVISTKTSALDTKVFDDQAIEELKTVLFGDDKPFTNLAKTYLGTETAGKFTFDTKPVVKTITTTQVLPGGKTLSNQATGIVVVVNKDHKFADTGKLNEAYVAKKVTAADKQADLEDAQFKLTDSYTDAQKQLIAEKEALEKIWDGDTVRPTNPTLTGDAFKADGILANNELLARRTKEEAAVNDKDAELPASYTPAQKILAQNIVDAQTANDTAAAEARTAYAAYVNAKKTWANDSSTKFANVKNGDYEFEAGQKIFLTVSNVSQRMKARKMMLATSQLEANDKVLAGVPLAMQGAKGEEALANFILPVTNSVVHSNAVTTIDIDKDSRGEWLNKDFKISTRQEIINKSFKAGQKVNVTLAGVSYQLSVDTLVAGDLSGSAFNSGQSKQTEWNNSFQTGILRNILYMFKKDFPSVDVAPIIKSAFLREKDDENTGPAFTALVKNVFAEQNDVKQFGYIPMFKPNLVIPGWMQDPVTMRMDITGKRSSDAKELGEFYDKYRKLLQERKTPVELILTYHGDTISYIAPVDPKNAVQPEGQWEHYMTLLENLCNKPSIADLIQGI